MAQRVGNNAIWVNINYRLGALGFLGGKLFESQLNKTAHQTSNSGLLDQEFALLWVKSHISRFGGDPSQVTLWGQSAGGGSVMHQLVLHGGSKEKNFQRAFAISPGYEPRLSSEQLDLVYRKFLSESGCDNLDCLTALQSTGNLTFLMDVQKNVQNYAVNSFSKFPPLWSSRCI
jgi:carboxylesterase type B